MEDHNTLMPRLDMLVRSTKAGHNIIAFVLSLVLHKSMHLKGMLQNFAEISGLKVNFDKSMMIPIILMMTDLICWLLPLVAQKALYLSLIWDCL